MSAVIAVLALISAAAGALAALPSLRDDPTVIDGGGADTDTAVELRKHRAQVVVPAAICVAAGVAAAALSLFTA